MTLQELSKSKNPILEWMFRTHIPEQFLLQKNSQTGTILYTNAELIELTDFKDK